jgi:hypothetical protein
MCRLDLRTIPARSSSSATAAHPIWCVTAVVQCWRRLLLSGYDSHTPEEQRTDGGLCCGQGADERIWEVSGGVLSGNQGLGLGCSSRRTTAAQTTLTMPTTGYGTIWIRLGVASASTNGVVEFADEFRLDEVPTFNCVGHWSHCTVDCPTKVFTVVHAKSGSGAQCPATHLQTGYCQAGEGNCPSGCAGVTAPQFGTLGTCTLLMNHAATCALSCNTGYTISGAQPSCNDGNLNMSITCTPNNCTLLNLPSNTSYGSCSSDGSMMHGSSCNLACMDGYTLSGGQPTCAAGVVTTTVLCIPDIDCVGSWTACGSDCQPSTFNVTNTQSGSGVHCPHNHGDRRTCVAGIGGCPASWHCRPDCPTGSAACAKNLTCDTFMNRDGVVGSDCGSHYDWRCGSTIECGTCFSAAQQCHRGQCRLASNIVYATCSGIVAPVHGALGNCSNTLLHAQSCTLSCNAGYVFSVTGVQPVCLDGMLSWTRHDSCVICAAGRFAATSDATCRVCPNGWQTDTLTAPGATACTACAAGQFSPTSTVACAACPVGKFQGVDGRIGCSACNKGSTTDSLSAPGGSQCTPCAPGMYSAQPNASCARCLAGSVTNLKTGASSCTECAPGFYSANPNVACAYCSAGAETDTLGLPRATTCRSCSAGQYSGSSLNSCAPCLSGSVTDTGLLPNATSCTACPAGKFSTRFNITCRSCPLTQYQPNIGQSVCIDCPAGSSAIGGKTCTACQPGMYSPNSSTPCTSCPAGSMTNALAVAHATTCTACAAGKFSPASTSACAVCSAGSVTNTLAHAGAAACSACAVGRSSSASTMSCEMCASGQYQGTAGQHSCVVCFAGSVTNTAEAVGATACTSCGAGQYSAVSSAPCVACSAGSMTNTLASSGATLCTSCASGQYSQAATVACAVCPSGWVTNTLTDVNGTMCTACEAGQYSAVSTAPCAMCAVGQFQSSVGQSSCDVCPAGSATNSLVSTGATKCTQCRIGQYSPRPAVACAVCQAGSVTDTLTTAGATTCTQCVAGQHSSSPARACSICLRNQYSAASATYCEVCHSHSSALLGSTSAADCLCNKGFTAGDNTSICTSCPVDAFKNTLGADACTKCPLQSSTNGVRAATELHQCICDSGYQYRAAGSCGALSGLFTVFMLGGRPTCTPHPTTCPPARADAVECRLDACASHPCQNGGHCSDGGGRFLCRCPPGWGGPSCTIAINECGSAPCRGKGTVCTDGVDSYTCSCGSGYYGQNCEHEINECSAYANGRPVNLCGENGNGGVVGSNGTCHDAIGRFWCHCNIGFYGTQCDFLNEDGLCSGASRSSCDSRHTNCYVNGGRVYCSATAAEGTCFPGYETSDGGTTCTMHDACAVTPCRNSGACTSSLLRYSCSCASGFAGHDCEFSVSACASLPCARGRCVDMANGYRCNCDIGWGGLRCTQVSGRCTRPPNTTGYDLSNALEVLTIAGNSFSVTGITCTTGYAGSPNVSICALDTEPYTLIGCSEIVCQRPDNVTGYKFSAAIESLSGHHFNVTGVQCAVGYSGTVSASLCYVHRGPYSLSGCSACLPGQFTDRSGALNCLSCPSGSTTDSLLSYGASRCIACAVGRFDHDANATTECTRCRAGTADTDQDPVTPCIICEAARFSSAARTTCSTCPSHSNSTEGSGQLGQCLCDPGYFGILMGPVDSCQPCAAGSYTKNAGQRSCVACPGVNMSVSTHDQGSTSVQDCFCKAGFFGRINSTDATCQPCRSGAVASTDGMHACKVCQPGRWSVSSTLCKACPSGSVTDRLAASGATSCQACAPGSFSRAPTISCALCAAGSVTDNLNGTGSTSCKACVAGLYSNSSQIPCTHCRPGSIASTGQFNGSVACTECAVGRYSNVSTVASCTICTAGSMTDTLNDSGATSCTACLPGQFSMSPNINCSTCNASIGSYAAAAATDCTVCAPGMADTDHDAATPCIRCPVGTYTKSGAHVCTECPAGTADDDFNASTLCRFCDNGYYSAPGSMLCTACLPGQFSMSPNINCSTCNASIGSYAAAAATDCTVCAPGMADTDHDAATPCIRCPVGTYTKSGAHVCTECPAGTAAIPNAACSAIRGFVQSNGRCVPAWCTGSTSSCVACPRGTFATAGATSCDLCPTGTFDDDFDASTNCTEMVCTRPSSHISGYDFDAVSETLTGLSFSVSGLECTAGFRGTPITSACVSNRGPYTTSGCIPLKCSLPVNVTGYDVTQMLSADVDGAAILTGIRCAAGFEGTVTVNPCNEDGGPHNLTGCRELSPEPEPEPEPEPYIEPPAFTVQAVVQLAGNVSSDTFARAIHATLEGSAGAGAIVEITRMVQTTSTGVSLPGTLSEYGPGSMKRRQFLRAVARSVGVDASSVSIIGIYASRRRLNGAAGRRRLQGTTTLEYSVVSESAAVSAEFGAADFLTTLVAELNNAGLSLDSSSISLGAVSVSTAFEYAVHVPPSSSLAIDTGTEVRGRLSDSVALVAALSATGATAVSVQSSNSVMQTSPTQAYPAVLANHTNHSNDNTAVDPGSEDELHVVTQHTRSGADTGLMIALSSTCAALVIVIACALIWVRTVNSRIGKISPDASLYALKVSMAELAETTRVSKGTSSEGANNASLRAEGRIGAHQAVPHLTSKPPRRSPESRYQTELLQQEQEQDAFPLPDVSGIWRAVAEQADAEDPVDFVHLQVYDGGTRVRGHECSPSDEPFEIGQSVWDGRASSQTLRFVQKYADGETTTWTAQLHRDPSSGVLKMRNGHWHGACDGTFSATLDDQADPADPAGGKRPANDRQTTDGAETTGRSSRPASRSTLAREFVVEKRVQRKRGVRV